MGEHAVGVAFCTDTSSFARSTASDTVLLTLCQSTYLGNFSVRKGRGYVNARISKELYHELKCRDGTLASFRNPGHICRAAGEPEKLLRAFSSWQILELRHS